MPLSINLLNISTTISTAFIRKWTRHNLQAFCTSMCISYQVWHFWLLIIFVRRQQARSPSSLGMCWCARLYSLADSKPLNKTKWLVV